MPPSGKLPAGEIDVLTRWVKEGYPVDRAARHGQGRAPRMSPAAPPRPSQAGRGELLVAATGRPPAGPAREGPAWCRNPIDAFLLARLEAEGLQPAPEADRVTLIRRLELRPDRPAADPRGGRRLRRRSRADAYERLVDRLLDSPHYGEKWGRHWLDLVRYAETNGYERDSAKPFAWRYRDYVIDAFNRDKPYDQFIREQLAGDEIDPGSAEALIATGYLPAGHLGRRAGRPAAGPLRRARRHHLHDRPGRSWG